MFLVIILYALLALTFILAKNAVQYSSPCFLIGFRMIIAGVCLLGYYKLRYKKQAIVHSRDIWLFVKTSFFHIYCAFVLEFWALQYLTALKTNIIYASTPFLSALMSHWLLNERLNWQKVTAITIGFCGLLPVIFTTSTTQELSMEIGRVSVPEIVLFIAVISSLYAWFLVKQLMDKNYQLSFINGFTMLTGGVLSMLTSCVVEDVWHAVSDWPAFLWWIALLIIAANLCFYNLYGWLLHTYSITFITFAGFLCPLFGVLYEWLFMGGIITWHYYVSIASITVGLTLFYLQERRP